MSKPYLIALTINKHYNDKLIISLRLADINMQLLGFSFQNWANEMPQFLNKKRSAGPVSSALKYRPGKINASITP